MKFFSLPKALALAGVAVALVAAPARADEPTPKALALASQLITDINLKASVDNIIPLTLGEFELRLAKIHPEMSTALKEAGQAILPEFANADEMVIRDLSHVLAVRMSEAELTDSIKFFESPVGKKYLTNQGVLLTEFSAATNIWRQELNDQLVKRLHDEMKKKGYDF